MEKKEKFKKGDILFFWNQGGHTDEIVIILGINKSFNKLREANKDNIYYFCMFL